MLYFAFGWKGLNLVLNSDILLCRKGHAVTEFRGRLYCSTDRVTSRQELEDVKP